MAPTRGAADLLGGGVGGDGGGKSGTNDSNCASLKANGATTAGQLRYETRRSREIFGYILNADYLFLEEIIIICPILY